MEKKTAVVVEDPQPPTIFGNSAKPSKTSPKTKPAPTPRQSLVVPVAVVAPTAPVVPQFALEESKADDDAMQDLQRFFAVRDQELAAHSANDSPTAGYESTEPSPLARH